MPVTGWRGDPCIRCTKVPPRAATHHGMCSQCWLGATASDRRMALLEEATDASDSPAQLIAQFMRDLLTIPTAGEHP